MPDRLNLYQFIFRLNLAVTGIVFILLLPTVHVYQWWFPDKKDSLWFYPAAVLLGSCLLWLLASMSVPLLIRLGLLEDLRKTPRPEKYGALGKFLKTLFPVALTAVHLGIILFCAVSLINFLKSHPFEYLFTNLP